jgi:hypothetical protein
MSGYGGLVPRLRIIPVPKSVTLDEAIALDLGDASIVGIGAEACDDSTGKPPLLLLTELNPSLDDANMPISDVFPFEVPLVLPFPESSNSLFSGTNSTSLIYSIIKKE